MIWIFIPLAAYLVGAVPFGRIIARAAAQIDIRERGSGNIGATNVAREVGMKWGLLTLVLDGIKGAVPVVGVAAFQGEVTGLAEAAGLAAIVGHQFSVFLGLRGGKGVATALGFFAALEPLVTVGALVVFLVAVGVTDYVSSGSMAAAGSVPVFLCLCGGSYERIAVAAAVAALIVLAHRENIGRLIRGEERKWRRGKINPRVAPGDAPAPRRNRNGS